MKKLLIACFLIVGCAEKAKECPKPPPPKFLDLCVNGVRIWQDMNGKRGLMVELDGFRPVKCK